MRSHELTGKTYGALHVLERVPDTLGKTRWRCRCECGTIIDVHGSPLVRGVQTSCGCRHSAALSARNLKHGHAIRGGLSRTYIAWQNMKDRCTNPKSENWKYYGGRGIRVCKRWLNSFENFLADMGECPPRLTLDRIRTNGHYRPSNCRWATWTEQQNNRRNNRTFTARFDNNL